MWLYRGAQSAVFYYVTCTPCANSLYRRKRKKEAVRTQRQKEKSETHLVTDQPRPFQQPSPFSTNDGWREEISLGPGPPARRGGHRNNNHHSAGSWTPDQDPQKKDKSGVLKHPLGERLWMRYQREDEPLWGQEVRGSSIGFSGGGRADPYESSKYYIACVPPVNDLHPPIVSGPRSRAETRWMLQPPPSARVMAGKERVSVSPRDSMGDFDDDGRLSRVANTDLDLAEGDAERINNELGDGALGRTAIKQLMPRRPSLTRLRGGSGSVDGYHTTPHSRSDSMFSTNDSDDRPRTPASRPLSKATNDSSKMYMHPQISKTVSTLQRDKKKVHLLQVEINDDAPDEIGVGQLKRIRPWRWSMDI